jgi:hypothetical protein
MLLSACGGGDESSTRAFNTDAAMTHVLAHGVNFTGLHTSVRVSPATATALAVNDNYNLTVSHVPTTDADWFGKILRRTVRTLTITKNNLPLGVTSTTILYSLAPARLEVTQLTTGTAVVYATPFGLPTSALVGQSGTFNTHSTNSVATSTSVIGTGTSATTTTTLTLTPISTGVTAWSLEPDSESNAWFCLTTTTTSGDTAQKECYRINTDGAVFDAKFTMPVDGKVLTFTSDG